jgi:hypothetical protein
MTNGASAPSKEKTMSVDLNFHRVTKIEIGDVRSNSSESYSYDVRSIIITHDDGQRTEISLFGKHDEEDLLRVSI